MLHKLFTICLLTGITVITFGQQVKVLDNIDHEPLAWVTISSNAPEVSTMTNENGIADLAPFKNAQHIELRLIGYEPVIASYQAIKDMGFKVFMPVSAINLHEVVVSASYWKQSRAEVPRKITAVTPKQVELQNPQTAADLLGISGNVFIQKSQQGGGSPMIRGFATHRLLYSVDGVRMNTAIFRGGNIQNVISLDPYAIEHTEVLSGAGPVIYGSDAIGGVMVFNTLTPEFSNNNKVHQSWTTAARYASANNEKTGHAHVSLGWKKWAMLTSVSSFNYGDLTMGSHGPDEYLREHFVGRINNNDVVFENDNPKKQKPSGYSQMNLMQKIRYQPNKHWNINYGFHYSETSDYPRYDRHIRYDSEGEQPKYAEWSYGPQIWMMNNLEVIHHSHNIFYDNASVRMAWQQFEESRMSRDFQDVSREARTEHVQAYSVNIDLVKPINQWLKIFYGSEAVMNVVDSKGTNTDIGTGLQQKGPSRYPEADWQSYGIYGSAHVKATDKLNIQMGLRYNLYALNAQFDTTFYPFPFTSAHNQNENVTTTAGLVYQITPRFSVTGNFATAFRSPNIDDMGKVFDSSPGSVTVPNPGLHAEYAYSYDLGMAKSFGHFLKLELTGFYTHLANAMVRRPFLLNGNDSILYDGALSEVMAIQNAAVSNVFGFEGDMEIHLPGHFGLQSQFNYQQGEEMLDDGSKSPSRHAPPWFGRTAITYRESKVNLMFYAWYSGEKSHKNMPLEELDKSYMYASNEYGKPYSPSWYTINFKAAYDVKPGITLSAGVENITDQRYRPYSSGIVAPGRNFILAVKAQF